MQVQDSKELVGRRGFSFRAKQENLQGNLLSLMQSLWLECVAFVCEVLLCHRCS